MFHDAATRMSFVAPVAVVSRIVSQPGATWLAGFGWLPISGG
jgi:hypothetical protein